MSVIEKSLEASTLNCSECAKALGIAIRDRGYGVPPVMLWGGVGAGKSSIVRQTAERLNLSILDLRLALLNPVDLRGLPVPDREAGQAGWLPPSFLPDVSRDGGEGVLFLDEVNAAPPAVQAAAYQLVLDRRVGDYELPEGWRIVAAGNRMTDRGVTHKMPAPLANRLLHLHVEPTLDDWKNWALGTGEVRGEVIAFLNLRPELLTYSAKSGDNGENGSRGASTPSSEMAFPSPRSWEFASRVLDAAGEGGLSGYIPAEMIAGCVGEKAALEFRGFLGLHEEIPDPVEVLRGEADMPSPEHIDRLYAVSAAVINLMRERARERGDGGKSDSDNFFEYVVGRMPEEVGMLTVRDALRVKELKLGLGMGEAYKRWMSASGHLLR